MAKSIRNLNSIIILDSRQKRRLFLEKNPCKDTLDKIKTLLEEAEQDESNGYESWFARNGNWALYWAAISGHVNIVELILKNNYVKKTAANDNNLILICTAEKGHHNVVKLLLENSNVALNAHASRNWALYKAVSNGHYKVVDALLNIPVIFYTAGEFGNWPLLGAAEKGYDKIVELLLKNKSVLKSISAQGHFALRKAIERNHEKVVSVLFSAYKKINCEIPFNLQKFEKNFSEVQSGKKALLEQFNKQLSIQKALRISAKKEAIKINTMAPKIEDETEKTPPAPKRNRGFSLSQLFSFKR